RHPELGQDTFQRLAARTLHEDRVARPGEATKERRGLLLRPEPTRVSKACFERRRDDDLPERSERSQHGAALGRDAPDASMLFLRVLAELRHLAEQCEAVAG